MSNVDPYAIITGGVYSENPDALVYDGIGYFVHVEEVEKPKPPQPPAIRPITISSGSREEKVLPKKKKYLKLTVKFEDDIEPFSKVIEVTDEPNVRIKNINFDSINKVIYLDIEDVNFEDKQIKLKYEL